VHTEGGAAWLLRLCRIRSRSATPFSASSNTLDARNLNLERVDALYRTAHRIVDAIESTPVMLLREALGQVEAEDGETMSEAGSLAAEAIDAAYRSSAARSTGRYRSSSTASTTKTSTGRDTALHVRQVRIRR
jgi:hypothetical protein